MNRDNNVALLPPNNYVQYAIIEQKKISRLRTVYRRRMVVLILLFICLLSGVLYMMHTRGQLLEKKRADQVVLQEKLDELQEKKESLQKELIKINDDEYIDKLARQQFHMTKDNEILFLIPSE